MTNDSSDKFSNILSHVMTIYDWVMTWWRLMNPVDDLDNNVEDLFMTLMTAGDDMLTTLTTNGEDLLMTHDDDTDDYCDNNVLWSCYDVLSCSFNKEIDMLCAVYNYNNKYSSGKDYLYFKDLMGDPRLLLKSMISWDPIPDVVLKTVGESCLQWFFTNFTDMVSKMIWYYSSLSILWLGPASDSDN